MSLLLKDQVAVLQDDLDQLQQRLSLDLCVPVHADADEAVMTRALQRTLADHRHAVDSLAEDVRRVHNEAELKRWLKAEWQLAKVQLAATTPL
jgi:hypothetical protein